MLRRGLRDLVTMPLPTQYGDVTNSVQPQAKPAVVSVSPAGNLFIVMPNGATYPALQQADGSLIVAGPQTKLPSGSVALSPLQSEPLQSFPPTPAYQSRDPYPNPGQTFASPYPSGFQNSNPPPLAVPSPVGVPLSPAATAPGGPWGRQPIIPDALLPPTLQRGNPLVRQYVYKPNIWDGRLKREARAWSWIRAHGGMKSCCRMPELGAPVYDNPPWIVMPSQAEKFEQMFSQPLSAFQDGTGAFTGLDVILGRFVVPNGWDGAINRVVFQFAGNGFVDFSGDVVWRVQVNERYVRNLGNVKNTFGDFATAFSVPGSDNIRLVSQQTVTLIANIPVGSPVTDGPVMAGAFGWFYPRR